MSDSMSLGSAMGIDAGIAYGVDTHGALVSPSFLGTDKRYLLIAVTLLGAGESGLTFSPDAN
uniref:hypothetical protein n=1 Tax=unclassified Pseudomonas TaxID=196821 RepID=UPI0030D88909